MATPDAGPSYVGPKSVRKNSKKVEVTQEVARPHPVYRRSKSGSLPERYLALRAWAMKPPSWSDKKK